MFTKRFSEECNSASLNKYYYHFLSMNDTSSAISCIIANALSTPLWQFLNAMNQLIWYFASIATISAPVSLDSSGKSWSSVANLQLYAESALQKMQVAWGRTDAKEDCCRSPWTVCVHKEGQDGYTSSLLQFEHAIALSN